MFYTHNLEPIAFTLFGFPVRWYGISYLLFYLTAIYVYPTILKKRYVMIHEKVTDFVTFCLISALIGGRVGHVFGYEFSRFINDPISLFKVWNGGMSFHGGLVGVLIFTLYKSRCQLLTMLRYLDCVAMTVPCGILLGRIANFINAEIIGTPTDQTWGVFFHRTDLIARHPVPLYEAFIEGFIVGAILIYLFLRTKLPEKPGAIAAIFAILYAITRIICEFWRMPDGIVHIFGVTLSLGQFYSIPVLVSGLALISYILSVHAHQDDNQAAQKLISIEGLK